MTFPSPMEFNVYPNPTQVQVTIDRAEGAEALFQLYNALGQRVFRTKLRQQQETIFLGRLPTGYYNYTIGQGKTGTLIIQQE